MENFANFVSSIILIFMDLSGKIRQIDELKALIENKGKLADEIIKKINYKFRLEWNYTSNSMEGNSLTKQETRTVMIGNITVEGKPIQDILEMRNHDDLISTIIKMGRGEMNISEKRIKEIHSSIIYEEDPEKKKLIGNWKISPNYLINYKGERFDFIQPDEVADKMHLLINWLNSQKEKIERGAKDAMHPVALSLQFHLDYVGIHPFYDGNGRTSRILTNIILISYGFPPIYIKTNERERYYQYLADIQGYGGAPDLFYDFMANLVIRSQQIVLDAINGKDIDEPDDLDKRIEIIRRNQAVKGITDEMPNHLNKAFLINVFEHWLGDLLKKGIIIAQKFNGLFLSSDHHIGINPGVIINFSNEAPDYILSKLLEKLEAGIKEKEYTDASVIFFTKYKSFKSDGIKSFDIYCEFKISFDTIRYEVAVERYASNIDLRHNQPVISKFLQEPVSEIEIDNIVKLFGDAIATNIEKNEKTLWSS
jgi:Fic family protein